MYILSIHFMKKKGKEYMKKKGGAHFYPGKMPIESMFCF